MEDPAPSRRRGAFIPSLVAALGILAFHITTTTLLNAIAQIGNAAPPPLEFLLGDIVRWALQFVVIAAVCLVSFWLVAPIVARLSLGSVIARVLVAAGVLFVVLVPLEFAFFYPVFTGAEPMSAEGLYDLTPAYADVADVLLIAVNEALATAIGRLPEIALAAVALWSWLRRKEPTHGEA